MGDPVRLRLLSLIASHKGGEVESQSVADELHFLGSPTFTVEGRDLSDEPGRPAALACRIYPEGHALPSLRDLRRALKEAAAAPAPQ